MAPPIPESRTPRAYGWDPPFPVDLRRVRPVEKRIGKDTPRHRKPSSRSRWDNGVEVASRHLTSVRSVRELRRRKNEFDNAFENGSIPCGRHRRSEYSLAEPRCVAWRNQLRRVLRLLQLLPCRLGILVSAFFFKLNVERRIGNRLLRAVGLGPNGAKYLSQ